LEERSFDKPIDGNFFDGEVKDLAAVREGVDRSRFPENKATANVVGLPRMLQERLNQLTVFCQTQGAKNANEFAMFAGMLFVETPNSVHRSCLS
jgi:hypothetical protein